MDEFKVKVGQVRDVAARQSKMAGELDSMGDELNTIRNNLRFKISQRERINRRLTQQAQALEQETSKMSRLSSSLSDIADVYERTECALGGFEFEGAKAGEEEEKIKFFPSISIPGGGDDDGKPKKDDAKSIMDKIFDWVSDTEDKVSDWSDGKQEDLYQKKYEHDIESDTTTTVDLDDEKAVKKFDDDHEKAKMEADIKIATIGSEASIAAWNGKALAGDEKGTHASAEASLLEAEAHAEAYAGLTQIDPVTGEKTFKPGFGASVGASVSLFTAEEEAQLGSDTLGVYAKSTQTIGRLGAEAETSVGLYDAEGEFNPSAYGELSAEAIAGEITASVGAKVLGTDVGVTGSLNYGIGAHASAGYKDGKLSLDIGATLGVGASVKLEIDVSGTVNAACDAAKAAWDGFWGLF